MIGAQTKPEVRHHESKELGLSFDLPERIKPSVDARFHEVYQRGMKFAEAQGLPFLGGVAYAATVGAALESGLIQNWKCKRMPSAPVTEDDVDIAVVYFVAPIVLAFVEEKLHVPKASFWRRVMLALTAPTRRQN